MFVSNIKYHRQILPAFRLVTYVTCRVFRKGTFLVWYDLDKRNNWVLRAICVPDSGPDIFELLFLIFMVKTDLFETFRWVNYTSESLKRLKQGQGWHRFSNPGQITPTPVLFTLYHEVLRLIFFLEDLFIWQYFPTNRLESRHNGYIVIIIWFLYHYWVIFHVIGNVPQRCRKGSRIFQSWVQVIVTVDTAVNCNVGGR